MPETNVIQGEHTPDKVLERVVSDLTLGVRDLAQAHAVDGGPELRRKLCGIATTAMRAIREVYELELSGAFAFIQAEAEMGEARDRRLA